jgi:uroporphyrinogen-III synthase
MAAPEATPATDAAGPLTGRTVVVTRSAGQASALTDRLHALGATTVEVTTIAIDAPADGGEALDAAIARQERVDRIAVSSPNGARALLAACERAGAWPSAPVACVGPSTALVLDGSPLRVDTVPDRNLAEGLVEAVGAPTAGAERLLLVQAEVARTVLADGFAAAGWQVDRVVAYRTVDGVVSADDIAAAAAADAITFTSSSTVERFVRLAGRSALPPAVISIGPITSETARSLDVAVTVEADPHTLDGLIEAAVTWSTTLRSDASVGDERGSEDQAPDDAT